MPAPDLTLITEAARNAGNIAKGFFGNDPKRWDKPEDAGPVTEADLAVDAYLTEALRPARPDYGWLSEETEDDTTRLHAEHIFIIDPIDGTRAFIAGQNHWAISIAIARARQIAHGVVYLPMLDRMYAASLGGGAVLNDAPLNVARTPVSPKTEILSAQANFDPKHWPGGVPDVARNFRPSLAYRLCLVASGRFDGMLSLRRTWEWDVAAGGLIAAEAGAIVTDQHGHPPIYNNPKPSLAGMVCASPPVHAHLSARLGNAAGGAFA